MNSGVGGLSEVSNMNGREEEQGTKDRDGQP